MTENKKWQPWVDFHKEIQPEVLPIEEPPCKNCKYWKPMRNYVSCDGILIYDGVILCHANEQHHDFSCFREKEEE